MSLINDTAEHVNHMLVRAADYYQESFDGSTYLKSLGITALVSPILPYIEGFLLIETIWNNNVLLQPATIYLSSLPQVHHWVFDLANENFFGFVSGNVEWFDAWWVVLFHLISQILFSPVAIAFILPVEMFVWALSLPVGQTYF